MMGPAKHDTGFRGVVRVTDDDRLIGGGYDQAQDCLSFGAWSRLNEISLSIGGVQAIFPHDGAMHLFVHPPCHFGCGELPPKLMEYRPDP